MICLIFGVFLRGTAENVVVFCVVFVVITWWLCPTARLFAGRFFGADFFSLF